ncbi:hypothetical protein [Cupriavidus taiwanensis]|uniref:hypothetical protein n=1 Tax=Cupriavidus taiwanensis TaxID=164546 RepID=UPI0011C04C15
MKYSLKKARAATTNFLARYTWRQPERFGLNDRFCAATTGRLRSASACGRRRALADHERSIDMVTEIVDNSLIAFTVTIEFLLN